MVLVRKDSPRDEAVKISMGITSPHHIGIKSIEVKKQELTSHIQNYQETFNNAEKKEWKAKFDILRRDIG